MSITIAPHRTLGATVTGVALRAISEAEWREIHDAFLLHGLLVFPDQHLSSSEQGEFARRFGELEVELMGDRPTVPISNRAVSGEMRDLGDPIMHILRGNEGWHTDSSYMPVSAKASMLGARVVPSEGGETEWADMRAAHDALDEDTRHRIADLAAHHSVRWSQARAGFPDHDGYGMRNEVAPLRPLVKSHPDTGRPALFIGRHAHAIPGLSDEESAALLDRLLLDACRAERTHRHHWAPGDLVVWDNRCLLHRAHPYDYREERVLMHTRIAGDPATESALHSSR